MNSTLFGENKNLSAFIHELERTEFVAGRILAEHKERYVVGTSSAIFDAEITGNLRFSASGREDFPCVGDWVKLLAYQDGFAIIHQIMPRTSLLKRRAAGKSEEIQLIAANVDFGLIIQSVDRDFNLNRIERYLTLCYDSVIKPIIIISKIDLVNAERLQEILSQLEDRMSSVPRYAISNLNLSGFEALNKIFESGRTYCLLGSSGVGKSTLLNNFTGKELMKTGEISESIDRGKHITTHRELIQLENGALLIDNPGMREVGIAGSLEGIEITFDEIIELEKNCRFIDCTHTTEKGCAVLEALQSGALDTTCYENFQKMQRERAHYESSQFEKRQKEKSFGKFLKNYKKDVRRNN